MDYIYDITSFGILVSMVNDYLKVIHHENKDNKYLLFSSKNLIDLDNYNSAVIQNIKETNKQFRAGKRYIDVELFKSLNYNLSHLAIRVQAINCNMLEMYFPGTGKKIARKYSVDSILSVYLNTRLFEQVCIVVKRQLADEVKQNMLNIHYGLDKIDLFEYFHKPPDRSFAKKLDSLNWLEKVLNQFRLAISMFISESTYYNGGRGRVL